MVRGNRRQEHSFDDKVDWVLAAMQIEEGYHAFILEFGFLRLESWKRIIKNSCFSKFINTSLIFFNGICVTEHLPMNRCIKFECDNLKNGTVWHFERQKATFHAIPGDLGIFVIFNFYKIWVVQKVF